MRKHIEVGTIFTALFNDGREIPPKYQPHVILEIVSRRPLVFYESLLKKNSIQKGGGGTGTSRNIGKVIGFIDVNTLIVKE